MLISLALTGSFLLGSIPFGLLISKYLFGLDLRQHGSGNIGAANAMRTIGRGGAIATLLLDAGKGYLPVFLVLHAFTPRLAMLAGAVATLGHCFSPWLRFRGGKGVATLLGTVLALNPLTALGCVAIYLICLAVTRISAIGSLAAGAFAPIGLGFAYSWLGVGYGILGFLLLLSTHRANIARLRDGTENIFRRG